MKKDLKVLIVEDHDVASRGLTQELLEDTFFSFDIYHAISFEQAMRLIKYHTFDVIFIDLILGNNSKVKIYGGDDFLKKIKNQSLSAKAIILSKVDSVDMLDYIINVLQADGYILKSHSSLREIIPAIKSSLAGLRYLSPSIKSKLKFHNNLLDLDYRDRVILKELSLGASHSDIVSILNEKSITITKSAIEKRIRKLKERFDAKTIAQLMVKAIKMGIIS